MKIKIIQLIYRTKMRLILLSSLLSGCRRLLSKGVRVFRVLFWSKNCLLYTSRYKTVNDILFLVNKRFVYRGDPSSV